MAEYAGRQSSTSGQPQTSSGGAGSPGKQTLVERELAAIQRRAAAGAAALGDGDVHAAAGRGTATAASALPHADLIQKSFGRHDISGIQAHTGADAAASAQDMGAKAYASGNHVVLGGGAGDLHTAAHEAAHVVQQRGGVQLKGGVGAEGDTYERHADAVADHVVQGKSAEGLLDQFAGGGASAGAAAGGGAIQRKVTIGAAPAGRGFAGGVELTDPEAAWAAIKTDPRLAEIQEPAKQLLATWIARAAKSEDPKDISENRHYRSNTELVQALAGEVQAEANLKHEGTLAEQTMTDSEVTAGLTTFIARLRAFHTKHETQLAEAEKRQGRYAGWAYGDASTTIAVGLGTVPTDLRSLSGFIADYALAMRKEVGKASKTDWGATMNQGMTPELNAGRYTHHNTDEASPWVIEARTKNAALSAGPSATTAQVLTLAVAIGGTREEKIALAWGLFAIWNTMPMHKSGTHRFHEVMSVAVAYGVPYDRLKYPEAKS